MMRDDACKSIDVAACAKWDNNSDRSLRPLLLSLRRNQSDNCSAEPDYDFLAIPHGKAPVLSRSNESRVDHIGALRIANKHAALFRQSC
jgi:hypothetical protein